MRRTIVGIKEDLNFKDFVDVCGGRMTLKDVNREIIHYMLTYNPSRLIVDIKKEDGYQVTIYIPTEEFRGGK